MRNGWLLLMVFFSTAALSCSPKLPEEKSPPDAGKQQVDAVAPVNPWAGVRPVQVGQHAKAATHVAFSPDGSMLLSTGKDKLIKLWNPASRELVRTLSGHGGDVAMADFSPDGKFVVSASTDETARVWEVVSGKQKTILKEKPPAKKLTEEEQKALAQLPPPLVNWAAFSPDASKVITASDDFALKLWDIRSGKKLLSFQDDGCRQRSVFRRRDADGWVSAVGCMEDGVTYLKFWDENGNLVLRNGNENQDAHYVGFDRAGKFIVTADGSLSMSIYSAQGSFLKRVIVGGYHFCVAFGADDKTLLVGTDGGEILVFRPADWVRVGKLDVGEKVAVDSLALNPRDGTLAAALRNGKVVLFTTPIR